MHPTVAGTTRHSYCPKLVAYTLCKLGPKWMLIVNFHLGDSLQDLLVCLAYVVLWHRPSTELALIGETQVLQTWQKLAGGRGVVRAGASLQAVTLTGYKTHRVAGNKRAQDS